MGRNGRKDRASTHGFLVLSGLLQGRPPGAAAGPQTTQHSTGPASRRTAGCASDSARQPASPCLPRGFSCWGHMYKRPVPACRGDSHAGVGVVEVIHYAQPLPHLPIVRPALEVQRYIVPRAQRLVQAAHRRRGAHLRRKLDRKPRWVGVCVCLHVRVVVMCACGGSRLQHEPPCLRLPAPAPPLEPLPLPRYRRSTSPRGNCPPC